MHSLKSLPVITFYTTIKQLDSHYICTSWFQGSTPAQPEIFVRIWFYTTLEEPDFNYIRTTWFRCSTPTQPETVVDEIIVHGTHTALISLHSYNLISRFCTYTTWNLSWSNDIFHYTLKLSLLCHSCYVCMFSCISPYFVHLFRKEVQNLFALAYILFTLIIKQVLIVFFPNMVFSKLFSLKINQVLTFKSIRKTVFK